MDFEEANGICADNEEEAKRIVRAYLNDDADNLSEAIIEEKSYCNDLHECDIDEFHYSDICLREKDSKDYLCKRRCK